MSASLVPNPRPPVSNAIRSIAFCGGGRWGSILFDELFKQVPPSTTLIWLTRDADKKKEEWRSKVDHGNIEFIEKWHDRLTECDGAVVATSVNRHYSLTRDFLSAAVPVLCEKPIAATPQQLDHVLGLSRTNKCPFGIHLEFAFLEAFDEFMEKANEIEVDRIQAHWFDPEIEIRGDIVKQAESQCDIISDQLPHVWSLVSRVVSKTDSLHLENLSYSTALTVMTGKLGSASLEIQLSRRHESRRRFISLNNGEATFDFCIEPPNAMIGNTPLVLGTNSLRPLQHTVRSFLAQVQAYQIAKAEKRLIDSPPEINVQNRLADSTEWLLSVEKYYPFLVQCHEISDRLRRVQDVMISQMVVSRNWESKERPHLQEKDVQMVLDRWLPQGIASGAWYRPGSKENDHEMAKQILTSLNKRC